MQRSITSTPDRASSRRGFTIVELLIVIAVIAVLATIVTISFGAWKRNTLSAQVKSDLNGAASAMENARNFGSGHPQSPLATTLTTFKPSNGVTLAGGGTVDGKAYCIDGTSSQDTSVQFYIASETKDQGPLSGACATRPTLPAPGLPSSLAVVSTIGTTVSLSWAAATSAASVACRK
jgi:prepilin-type N-terminal cleavage/methylation domain-containing protein